MEPKYFSDSPFNTDEALERRFTYRPVKPDQPERYKLIRDKAKELAFLIRDQSPSCPEQTRAFNSLDEVVMLTNAAIARQE